MESSWVHRTSRRRVGTRKSRRIRRCGWSARSASETGERHGAVKRVAEQLGFGVESVRSWVRQADIDDGSIGGVTTAEAERVRRLEQELKELRRANEILRRAATFFAAELDRPQR